ncbi:G:T/U mismatch-specific DNA glycosylase [Mycolicibacterium chubuense NBB4]|uniref:G:T/U mismatch-specific DNA glycosylase n=1 Tax=Mycolicibacterium chubuense (strain NBB4) TaxID=710421 RepID=I4BMS0_MYCCN|nr:DNA-deoxyinosine glycosylase [Mycolicibacterium chubuense]AFM18577.1 G:T/U mismatch-specific DNA glycosylase [Mycolicibacterium chubuense NBB4]
MTSPTLHSFPPLVATGARILILGNMPGVVSLRADRYYAHPRNAFWRITGALFGFDADAPYDERVAALTEAGVALWDVLKSCRRAGSLDAAVEPNSMVPNDFDAFFAAHPTIAHVCFNGTAAERNYRRLVETRAAMRYSRLPSTSPAHTASFESKAAAWRDALID